MCITYTNAALKEFATKGFDKASTNIIAKEAKISKPLMFHYVSNKQELFLCVYDYFAELLDKKYYLKMDFTEKDIFNRLRQSYLLQIELIQLYPWIFEFNRLSVVTNSDEMLEDIRTTATNKINSKTILQKLDEHFDELRKVFYTSIND